MLNAGACLTARPGPPAVAALRQLIQRPQGAGPLAPVDVVVPSSLAGVTLRRGVAGDGGLANVRFSSLPQLAERLAVRHLTLADDRPRRPVTPSVRARALRASLAAAGAGSLAVAALRHPATAGLLESVLAELDAAGVEPDHQPAALTPRGHEVLALHRAYRAEIVDYADEREVVRAAAEAVVSGAAPATHVVLVAHGAYDEDERALLSALHQSGRLSALLMQRAAEDLEGAAWVAQLFDQPTPEVLPVAGESVRLLAAPDAEEEVRLAVRTVLDHLQRTACRPERIGVAYGSSAPYVRLLAEQLSVAKVPHHVPRQRTLAQTVSGRLVLGLLDLHRRDHPRPDVLRWLADGPLVDDDGKPLPVVSWDRISREAAISRGLETWRRRLERYADEQEQQAEKVADDDVEATQRRDRSTRRAARARDLLATVQALAQDAQTALAAPSWKDAATTLEAALRRWLGGTRAVDRWTPADADRPALRLEQQSYDAVAAALRALAARDDEGAPPTPDRVLAALEEALDVTVPSGTTLGRGVLVAPVAQFAGADLDLLLVLGMSEGALPTRVRQHPILRDDDRGLLSPALRTSHSARDQERAAWLQALHGAGEVVLSYARADSRSQRRQFPSAWFVEQASALAQRPVGVGEFDATATGLDEAAWFTSVASFVSSSAAAAVHSSSHELDVALALGGGADALATLDSRLARGLAAARARGRAQFSAWTGSTGALEGQVRQQVDDHHSPSSLQTWATCPASYLFGQVLGVRALDDRSDDDVVDAREKGTLVHAVLEDLLTPELVRPGEPGSGRPPDAPWTRADLQRAQELLTAKAQDLESRGLTGRPVLWTAQLAQLRRALARVLSADSQRRRQTGSRPAALEAPFGRQGAAPLVVDLGTQGSVEFAGYIDRIDLRDDGGLVVIDYKTGSGYGREVIPDLDKPKPKADLIDRGRKLQLLLYALAARQLQGLPDAEVDAYYWYVELGERRGGRVEQRHEKRLVHVLDVVVGGIRNGVYPANPGGETWRSGKSSWENCTYCDFHRVCPTTRADQWRELSQDPLVQPYAAVTGSEWEEQE